MIVKRKKLKKLGFLCISSCMVILGCSEDFVTDPNNQVLTPENVISSETTLIASVTGVYDAFQNDSQGDPGLPNEYNVKGIHRWANSTGLDFTNNERPETSPFLNFSADPSTSEPGLKIWPNNYRQIGRANSTLETLQQAIDNQSIDNLDLVERLIGETLVLRAISYQYLAEVYGGVPIVLATTDDAFKARDSQDMVFQQVVADATAAIDRLPWTYDTERGRVTRATAYTVLGNAHMWLGQYAEAVAAYQQLENSPVLDLEENFLDIHALANPNGKESIFEIQWAANADLSWGRNDEVNILQLFSMPTDITGGGGFAGVASRELFEAYEPGDMRRFATVVGPGEEHPDPLIDVSMYDGVEINTVGTVDEPWTGNSPETRSGFWAVKSWRDPTIEGWGRSVLFGGQGHIWMRYGGALLSLSEAALRDGQMGVAQAAFDRVRNRAWGGTAPAKTVTMDALLEEYRLELADEFSYWGVLRRTGEATRFIREIYNIDIPAGHELYPIPSPEISTNPNLEQNPGY